MLKNKEYFNYLNEILLKQGLIFKKQGKIDESVTVFERITKDESGPKAVRGQAWFELGLIYQHVKGDFEKARECFQQANSLSTDKEILRIASERMQAISGLKGMTEAATAPVKDSVRADSARPIDLARYKLGEAYWLLLAEPDSALHFFRAISTDRHADSTTVIKGLFAQAWILRHLKSDSLGADSLFRAIITASPSSIFAQKSQKELGQAVTILTRADSARIAFIDAEKLYFDKGDAVAASNAYLRVYKGYPDLPDVAGRSLYAAAWLCDHAMYKKKVSAQKFYTMLCDSFPNSEWCLKEAKPRLKVFRDSLSAWEARRKSEPQDSAKTGPGPQVEEDGQVAPAGPTPPPAQPAPAAGNNPGGTPPAVPAEESVRPVPAGSAPAPSAPPEALSPPPAPAVTTP
jgi:tetratricopeptide (TPR) repeat protein